MSVFYADYGLGCGRLKKWVSLFSRDGQEMNCRFADRPAFWTRFVTNFQNFFLKHRHEVPLSEVTGQRSKPRKRASGL
jgi:hypothetical protein